MNRKRKILFVAAFIGLAALAILFLANRKPPEVTITYGGPATNQPALRSRLPERVFFNITNSSHKSISCFVFTIPGTNLPPAQLKGSITGDFVSLPPFSQTNCTVYVPPVKHWRVAAYCSSFDGASRFDRFRLNLADKILNRKWTKLRRWLYPVKELPAISGPLMFGNQPAPVEEK